MPGPSASIEEYLSALDETYQNIDIDAPSYREFSADDYPELYRRFAAIDLKSNTVLEFVNDFGFIGVGEILTTDEEINADGSRWTAHDNTVEFAGAWVHEVNLMKSSVAILDAIDEILKPDIQALSRLFAYRDGSWYVKAECVPGYRSQGQVEWVDLDIWAEVENTFDAIPSNDIVQAATEFLRLMVTNQLVGHTSAVVIWDRKHTRTQLVHRPTSLLSAMWVQFAGVLTQTNRFRSCGGCSKVFELIRRDKAFCSEACQKRYSRRKAKLTQNT
jgi:predicted nucleic acid-binding Zn ribbon protein